MPTSCELLLLFGLPHSGTDLGVIFDKLHSLLKFFHLRLGTDTFVYFKIMYFGIRHGDACL